MRPLECITSLRLSKGCTANLMSSVFSSPEEVFPGLQWLRQEAQGVSSDSTGMEILRRDWHVPSGMAIVCGY